MDILVKFPSGKMIKEEKCVVIETEKATVTVERDLITVMDKWTSKNVEIRLKRGDNWLSATRDLFTIDIGDNTVDIYFLNEKIKTIKFGSKLVGEPLQDTSKNTE